MPNLPAHIDLAYKAAQRLGDGALEVNLGYFILGSTTPDIRAMTHRRREEYHFAPLSFEAVGAGVRGLFNANPHLALLADLDGPTRAFVAGYITHLVADETWIVEMYRPLFANPDVFDDDVLGKVMDRVMQLELDHQSREAVDSMLPLLSEATGWLDVGFIPTDVLTAWREWVVEFVAQEFTWDRLQFMARRIAKDGDRHRVHQVAEDFLRDMPQSLERLFERVSLDHVVSYKEEAIRRLVDAVGRYLA